MTETITHIALKKLNGSNADENYKALNNVSFNVDDRKCLVVKADKVSDVEVVTNDIVDLVNDNEFRWIGRYDNVINSGGVKIHPEKIEYLLSKVITATFFISSLKDEKLGERVVLVIEGENQIIDLNYLKSLLPKYHAPKEVIYLNQFIRTDSGKIQRAKTLDQLL